VLGLVDLATQPAQLLATRLDLLLQLDQGLGRALDGLQASVHGIGSILELAIARSAVRQAAGEQQPGRRYRRRTQLQGTM
jgi:hypothetical protein